MKIRKLGKRICPTHYLGQEKGGIGGEEKLQAFFPNGDSDSGIG